MILVLHGAKKNAGDFLIKERGEAILRRVLPHAELLPWPRWEPVAPEILDVAEGVVLCGGPGLAEDLYPRVYAALRDVDLGERWLLPLAMGWASHPAEDRFRLTPESRQFLQRAADSTGWISARDAITARVLMDEAFEARVTGCVAWYHLPSLGTPLHVPTTVNRLVLTTPARIRNAPQFVAVARALAKRFPDADRQCAFHRGWTVDAYTRRHLAMANRGMADVVRRLGFRVVDASFSSEVIDGYGSADLHVGYRVHAHLAFLSVRRPSILISEDGRGIGQCVTLGDPYHLVADRIHRIAPILRALDQELNGFGGSHTSVKTIDATWPSMRAGVERLAAQTR